IPDADGPVTEAAGKPETVGAEADGAGFQVLNGCGDTEQLLPRLGLPDSQRPVPAQRGQPFPVAVQTGMDNLVRVPAVCDDLPAGVGVAHPWCRDAAEDHDPSRGETDPAVSLAGQRRRRPGLLATLEVPHTH